MANKQYISIIRLFDHCGIPTDHEFNLPRAKKQLQAEFGIAQGGFIEIDGYTYTRHDVFEEMEQTGFSKRLFFHKQIWSSPQILELLEKNTADLTTIYDEFKPFWSNKEFDEFFSPYFAGPFNYLSRTFLAAGSLREMGDLLVYEDFLQPADREEAFRPLRIFLDENIRVLRNINRENYDIMRPKMAHWIDSYWNVFFNNLPHEFYETKNDIATRLVNIGVAIQKSNRRDCKQMSEQLISLQEMPESLRSVIVTNHAVYNRSSGTGSFSWRGGFWIFWIIVMVIRAASSGGCGENNTEYQSIPFDNNTRYQLDSIIKKMKDSQRIHQDIILK